LSNRYRHRVDANGQNVIQRKTLIDGRDSWETVAAGDVEIADAQATICSLMCPEHCEHLNPKKP